MNFCMAPCRPNVKKNPMKPTENLYLPKWQGVGKNPHSQNETAKMAGKISHLPKWQCAKSHGVRSRTQQRHSAPTATFCSKSNSLILPQHRHSAFRDRTVSYPPRLIVEPLMHKLESVIKFFVAERRAYPTPSIRRVKRLLVLHETSTQPTGQRGDACSTVDFPRFLTIVTRL
jgi:hypothetical protein